MFNRLIINIPNLITTNNHKIYLLYFITTFYIKKFPILPIYKITMQFQNSSLYVFRQVFSSNSTFQ